MKLVDYIKGLMGKKPKEDIKETVMESKTVSPIIENFKAAQHIHRFDRTHFFKTVREAFVRLNQTQVDALNKLLDCMEQDASISDMRHFAYMMATVKHETADTYLPIREYGKGRGRAYSKVINGQVYYGRGYVQLTWYDNYKTMGSELEVDLIHKPDLALDQEVAYKVMSLGMRKGLFTGKSLNSYINTSVVDYVGARRIINGTDKARLIAGYAVVFEKALRAT